jgi:hypothetical protein
MAAIARFSVTQPLQLERLFLPHSRRSRRAEDRLGRSMR